MASSDKNFRIIRKGFEEKKDRNIDKIRFGNQFVDDFIFEDSKAADIPINALRVIFNIISIISNEQFRPQDRPKQLSLFDEDFETENNVFVSIKIKNNKISPSGSTKQVIDAYEFLAKFKMGWYKSVNSKGKEIRTFGGLISTPSYEKRGYTTFLVSSYWLKRLLVIPEYNYILYNLVYNVRNNKHVIFAIWLSKLPEKGTALKLSTFNKKFGLNYKTTKDFCFKFLKLARISLNTFNTLSFNYTYNNDTIFIIPFFNNTFLKDNPLSNSKESFLSNEKLSEHNKNVTKRLFYFKKRYGLHENEMIQFSHQYRNIPQTRALIENAFIEFIKKNRLKGIKSTVFQGMDFLNEMQKIIIQLYQCSKMGVLLPNGYPIIM
ncbi:hypothetical protein [Cloacibacterium sp.]|uniref:hypothetical protein n=1 Tax=Cloacibacterium sp. TaxID=1913682 RepID=UPI0039E2A74E